MESKQGGSMKEFNLAKPKRKRGNGCQTLDILHSNHKISVTINRFRFMTEFNRTFKSASAVSSTRIGIGALEEQFVLFSKFGDARSDGKTITLTQSDKWLKQAQIIDGRTITLTDTGVVFNRFKSRTINLHDFVKYIEELAREKQCDSEEMKSRLLNCGPPGTHKLNAPPLKQEQK